VLCLAIVPSFAQIPETCDDNFDNNNNNLVDCADPGCSGDCADAFPCWPDPELYQVRNGNELWTYDVFAASWQQVTPWNNSGTRVNAMGYNVQDGYIYGIEGGWESGAGFITTNDLVRVTRDGMTVVGDVNPLPVPTGSGADLFWHAGDMDLDGNLYVGRKGTNSIWMIDVAALTATELLIANNAPLDVSDFTRSPVNGRFYGFAEATGMVREFEVVGTNVSIQDFTVSGLNCTGGCGATFSVLDGTLYFYCNQDGKLYKLVPDVAAAPTGFTVTEFPAAQIISTNDGASCPLASEFPDTPGDCCERVLAILESWGAPPGVKSQVMGSRPSNGRAEVEVTTAKRAVLHQNKPNPFQERTVIGYDLSGHEASSAMICIFDMSGTLRSTHIVAPRTDGQLILEGGSLRPGMYLYSLILDDAEVDTKRMILLE